ncbi:6-hydroxymethylpterin diphosphokinase MptE-like protein [Desulfolutivibrio sp.]|uniref:6-hydroxymethylpterin diphosphokinase MptE-like protein n=1 Tax=Desulfolutivibrio sp. TaxID=2773296 RepID=UPI002F969C2E
MAVTQNIKVLGAFPADYAGEFLVRFGHVPIPEHIDRRMVHDLPRPAPESAASVTATPVDLLRGVAFLVDAACRDLDMDAVTDVQMEYLYRYYKGVILPNSSPLAPATDGVRPQSAPEIVRIVNKLRNMPYLLRYPLTEKLAGQNIRQPVLVLLPGPSLPGIGPRLAELARSHLVVAVSRTLEFCLEHGVAPDFVVQLDTYLIQRKYYEKLPPLQNTTLVALSLCPVHGIADRFKGVFFMDSFDTSVLKNACRMRENGLSTLMGCMGLAECLASPYALLVGADLSFPGDNRTGGYFNSPDAGKAVREAPPECILVKDGLLVLKNRAGRRVSTTLMYLAVAREAAGYARDIEDAAGVRFYVGNDEGILAARIPTLRPEELAAAPPLDRRVLAEKIGAALSTPERVEMIRLKVDCVKTIQALDQNLLFLEACRVRKEYGDLARHPIALFAEQERDFGLPADPEIRLGFSLRIARQWRRALVQAHNLSLAYMIARHGGPIPLVCLPDEAARPFPGLERLYPGFSWDVRPLLSPADAPQPEFPRAISYIALHRTLASLQVVFVTAAAREAFRYHFDVYGGDNLYYPGPEPTE